MEKRMRWKVIIFSSRTTLSSTGFWFEVVYYLGSGKYWRTKPVRSRSRFEHVSVRTRLNPLDCLKWKNSQHESSSSRRDEKLCLLHHFNLRSFTFLKSTRKVQDVFRPNRFWKVRVKHPNWMRIRAFGREYKPLPCPGSPAASYILERWRPIKQQHTIHPFCFGFFSSTVLQSSFFPAL